jgi:hypothetical protein
MRVLVDYPTNSILQVEKTPPVGEGEPINGKYSVPIPEAVTVYVNPDSFIDPASDPGSVVAQSYAGLLASFPSYENILFNPLIKDTDIDDLDLTAVLNEGAPPTEEHISRCQVGRGTGGPFTSGQAANTTAVLAANEAVETARPGVLISDTIDIAPLTIDPDTGLAVGADEFVVYWYLYEFETTEDVRSDFGAQTGKNDPALRRIIETDQEPADLQVFLSINDGATYHEVQRLVPIAFCDPGTLIRIAFKNNNPTAKVYVAAYALLF